MLNCVFPSNIDADLFKSFSGLTPDANNVFTIPMSLIKIAEKLNGSVTQTSSVLSRYLVRIDNTEQIQTPVTLVTSEGNNGKFVANNKDYWLVETAQGLDLYRELNGEVEQVDTPIKLLSEINTGLSTGLPTNYEWARLRLISRYRPFVSSFQLADTNFTRKPNLVIIDSGINFTHDEFQGLECEDFYALPVFDNDFRDQAGHGTGVASFACGANIGVHRHLRLLNCKVFNASFKPNAIELGYALDACLNRFVADPSIPMVVNCSWTVAKNTYLEGKFQDLISAGIVIVAASGNVGMDVGNLTPAGMVDVITAAACDIDDVGAGFNNFSTFDMNITTNYGAQIDIFAPGVDVPGANHTGDNIYATYSGTSISAGFVAGCMAAILAQVPDTYRATAQKILLDFSTKGVLLLDSEKFTYQQNRVAFLISADNNKAFVEHSFYLGVASEPITANIQTVLPYDKYAQDTGESFEYIIECDPSELGQYITVDQSGTLTVNPPVLDWQPDEKIRLISFVVKARTLSGSITYRSPNLIFFAANPDVQTSLDGEVATALENIDSQSFFAAWVKPAIPFLIK